MSVKLQSPASLSMSMSDLAALVTEQVCTFNALADLEVASIEQIPGGDFVLHLQPKQPLRAKGAPAS